MTLEKWFAEALKSGIVYYLCDHRARSGMGGWYSLFVVTGGKLERAWPNEDIPDEPGSLTFSEKLARKLGFRITKQRRSFYRPGCGYNRPLDILLGIARLYAPELTVYEVQERIRLESISAG